MEGRKEGLTGGLRGIAFMIEECRGQEWTAGAEAESSHLEH